MTLHDFLSLCSDEEANIKLEIDVANKDEYEYLLLWLSDYCQVSNLSLHYGDYIVTNYGFDQNCDIIIQIKQP